MALLIEAGQMTASDYVPTYPDLLLASEGASTDAIPVSGARLRDAYDWKGWLPDFGYIVGICFSSRIGVPTLRQSLPYISFHKLC